jgi:hypothetical protein
MLAPWIYALFNMLIHGCRFAGTEHFQPILSDAGATPCWVRYVAFTRLRLPYGDTVSRLTHGFTFAFERGGNVNGSHLVPLKCAMSATLPMGRVGRDGYELDLGMDSQGDWAFWND